LNFFVDKLVEKKLIFKKLKIFDLKIHKIRKKVNVLIGVDSNNFYHIIFFIEQKSKFLQKNVDEIVKIVDFIKTKEDHNFKKQEIFINAPLCSKAKVKLKNLKWRVFHDFM
jgi:hypothetical protein